MPQVPVEDNSRMSLRIAPAEKALLMRAVTLTRTSLTDFVIRTAVTAAREVIERAERVEHEWHQLVEGDRRHADTERPGLQSAHVEQVLDQPGQPVQRLVGGLEQLGAGAVPPVVRLLERRAHPAASRVARTSESTTRTASASDRLL